MLVQELFEGPIDVVGDVHGEIACLTALLERLGYSARGEHPEGRRLVFVGDIVDRGPESLAVVELVARLVAEGRAQCVLGNHELNILREVHKRDNAWFFEQTDESTRREIHSFFLGLPLALERPNLCVVHACRHKPSIELVRGYTGRAIDCFREAEKRIIDGLEADGLKEKAAQEQMRYPLHDRREPPPEMLFHYAESEYRKQMRNPVKVLTSGIERIADGPFWANGKWRFTHRVPWWDCYEDESSVVIGHYWRSRDEDQAFADEPRLFGDAGPTDTLGPAKRVMCIDYSIGWRTRERRMLGSRGPFRTALAAYRLQEHREPELVFSPS